MQLPFDASAVVRPDMSPAELQRIGGRIRQIGVARVLYGSDAAVNPQAYPKAAWEAFRRLPLTPGELRAIANGVAPYLPPSTP